MRRVVSDYDLFSAPALPHEHARELEAIDQILCANPTVVRRVWKDLQGHLEPNRRGLGRPGMTAQQVLRAAVVKQMNGFSYEVLAFHLADSVSYRRFCGFGHPVEVPGRSALARNIRRIAEETWHDINRVILAYAESQDVEDGEQVRIDPTVVESNIHHPTDNALLFDSVRTLARVLKRARKQFGVIFADRTKRAKKRHMAILNARTKKQRRSPYKDLLRVTQETVGYAENAIPRLRREAGPFAGRAQRFADELEHYLPLVRRVIEQTERRVFQGESVPATEKIVSIVEPHTDIIRKDRRDTYYGHKVTLSGGVSGLILDWVVEDGNPADSTLLTGMLDRHAELYGSVPQRVAVDGGFASKDNLAEAKERGVADIAFAKKRGLAVEDMVRSTWLYKKLRDFRAGIEGVISFLKRVFGLRRCTWKGAEAFGSYVGASVVSANLLILARHLMS